MKRRRRVGRTDLDLSLLVDRRRLDSAQEEGPALRAILEATLDAWRGQVPLDLIVVFDERGCGLSCFDVETAAERRCAARGVDCMGLFKIQTGFDGYVRGAAWTSRRSTRSSPCTRARGRPGARGAAALSVEHQPCAQCGGVKASPPRRSSLGGMHMHRARLLTAVLVLLPSAAACADAGPSPQPGFPERLTWAREARCSEMGEHLAGALGVKSACAVLKSAPAGATPKSLAALLGSELRLPPSVAARLMETELTSAWLTSRRCGPDEDARLAALYLDVARATPGTYLALGAFLARAPTRVEPFLALLEASLDPAAVAERLRGVLRQPAEDWPAGGLTRALDAWRLAREGVVPPLETERGTPIDEVLLHLAAFERLRVARGDDPALVPWAAALLAAAVQRSSPDLGGHVLDALPDALRADALARAVEASRASETWSQGQRPDEGYDAALDLAAMLLDAGHPTEGRRARAAAVIRERAGDMPLPGAHLKGQMVRRSVLAWHLDQDHPEDPFEVALGLRLEEGVYRVESLAVPLLRDTYPDAVRTALALRADPPPRRDGYRRPAEALRALLPEAAALLARFDAAAAARARIVLADLPLQGEHADSAADVRVQATVARLLEDPGEPIWAERRLPPGAAALSPPPRDPTATVGAPRGFRPVRTERTGKRIAVLALSQAVDPTGEATGGGYWLLLSDDGGRSWRHRYTGLREWRPYVAAERSSVPLLSGGEVRIEVRVRELDEESVTFPPIRVRLRRRSGPRLLVARLAALERDTDGDGLTDVLERRFLTDPAEADTDGDGIPDGADPFPQVAASDATRAGDPVQEKLAAWTAPAGARPDCNEGPPRGAEDESSDDSEVLPPPVLPDEARDGDVLFVEGHRAEFAGLRPRGRVIVLESGEQPAAERRFGAFYPRSFRVILRSRDGERVYIEWDEHWSGAGELLRRGRDGHWISEAMRFWIS